MAMIVEQAGGAARTGRGRMLDVAPTALHQRVPVIFGSRHEVERIERYHREHDSGDDQPFTSPLFNERSLFARRDDVELSPHDEAMAMSSEHPDHRGHRLVRRRHDSVTRTFQRIFRREGINAAIVEGDTFHRYDRAEMKAKMAEAQRGRQRALQPLRSGGQPFAELEALFRAYGESGRGQRPQVPARRRRGRALRPGARHVHAVEDIPPDTDLLFYEGLHGAVVTDEVDVAQHADLLIGVVPVINLEWIQKLHRDKAARGYSTEAVTDTILRRMPDYVNYICPQFAQHAHQFPARADRGHVQPVHRALHPDGRRELLVIRFANPQGHRLPLPAVDAARLVHVAAEHHRRARAARWTSRCSSSSRR